MMPHFLRRLFTKMRDGISCCDLYGYYQFAAKRSAKELRLFKSKKHGYPAYFSSLEEWQAALDKMIDAFELITNDELSLEEEKAAEPIIKEGLELYSTFYRHLWI